MTEQQNPTPHSQADHDLLIRLDTKMDRSAVDITSLAKGVEQVRHDVSVMSESMEVKIAAAVSGKADTTRLIEIKADLDKRIDDHEKRMRFMEKYIWMALGVLTVGQFVIGIAVALHK